MTVVIKSQTKEIEKGTLRIEKLLESDSKVPYYEGIFIPKNFGFPEVVIKRFSRISFKELESRI